MNDKAKKRLVKCNRNIKDLLQQIHDHTALAIDDGNISQQDTRTLQNWVRSLTEFVAEKSCIEWIHRPEKKK